MCMTYSLGFSVELTGLRKLAMGSMDDVNAISKSTYIMMEWGGGEVEEMRL
jgi:hypothetical protein